MIGGFPGKSHHCFNSSGKKLELEICFSLQHVEILNKIFKRKFKKEKQKQTNKCEQDFQEEFKNEKQKQTDMQTNKNPDKQTKCTHKMEVTAKFEFMFYLSVCSSHSLKAAAFFVKGLQSFFQANYSDAK